MRDEIRKVRAALARRESGRGKRFAPELRRRIADLGRRLREDGASWAMIGAELAMPTATVRRLCDDDAPAFAAVEVVDDAVGGRLVVVTPGGFRIEGLTSSAAAALVRKLS